LGKICIVEDEPSLLDLIKLNLELEGHQISTFDNGSVAMSSFAETIDYDLIILDVKLPDINGVEICKQIRATSQVPILFLSAKGTTPDRIEGLRAGANDYLPKPFDLEELILRTSILMNSDVKTPEDTLLIGKHEINFKTFRLINTTTREELALSKKEIGLIKLFSSKEGEVISRNEILDVVWGKDQFPTTRTIDNFILNFRKIFEEDPRSPKYFHSVRGVGYRFTL
jgi:two-component system alkaline phosphatase synthesis response regulator PhoP